MVKWKTFFVIFKGVSFVRNWLRPGSGLLKFQDKRKYYNFTILKHKWTEQINSNNKSNNKKKKFKIKKNNSNKKIQIFSHITEDIAHYIAFIFTF